MQQPREEPRTVTCSTCGECRNPLDLLRSGRNTLPDALASLSRGWGLKVQAADVAAGGPSEHASVRTAPRVLLPLRHPPPPMLGRPTCSNGLRCAFIPILRSLTSLCIQRCLLCPIFRHLATRTCRCPATMDVATDWWGGGGTSMTWRSGKRSLPKACRHKQSQKELSFAWGRGGTCRDGWVPVFDMTCVGAQK